MLSPIDETEKAKHKGKRQCDNSYQKNQDSLKKKKTSLKSVTLANVHV